MTILLDIAALFALLLALTFVPALGLRREHRITREIRTAQFRHDAEAPRLAAELRSPTAKSARPTRTAHRTAAPSHCAAQH